MYIMITSTDPGTKPYLYTVNNRSVLAMSVLFPVSEKGIMSYLTALVDNRNKSQGQRDRGDSPRVKNGFV
jgi:hypothetical protein